MKIIKKEDKDYPQRLLELNNPPKQLYVQGNTKLLNNKALAIVGSRKCTQYGIKHTQEFAKTIANHNITIISGGALGIDAVAHESAMYQVGSTIAVVGCGLNHVYPEENRELFNQILENNGCIISEYEPDEPVNMKNFPKRNKIISGLADAVFVVEAAYHSGSTITGRLGFEQGKNVFCLPRDIGITKGSGTNNLIKQGAKLVTTPQDILEEFGIKENKPTKEQTTQTLPKLDDEPTNLIPQQYLDIYNLISYTPQNIQILAKQSALPISQITQKLTMMELEGYIKSLPRKLLHKNIKRRKNVSKTRNRKRRRSGSRKLFRKTRLPNYPKKFCLQTRRNRHYCQRQKRDCLYRSKNKNQQKLWKPYRCSNLL